MANLDKSAQGQAPSSAIDPIDEGEELPPRTAQDSHAKRSAFKVLVPELLKSLGRPKTLDLFVGEIDARH